ncbi:SDR family oxidoreductase [soil metagenome]
MKVLVTGSNGFIAQHIISSLLMEPDMFVIGSAKGLSRVDDNEPDRYLFQSLDITNKESVDEVLAAHVPDVVIHSAAKGQPDFCEEHKDVCDTVNVNGTVNITDACKANDIYLLFISTDFVFNGEAGPYKEEDTCDPINYYGISKLKGEEYIKTSGVEYGIARLCSVYGFPFSGTAKNVVTFVKENLEKNSAVKIVTDQVRTPTFVGDVAKAIVQMTKKKAKGIFHIAGDETFTPYEIAIRTAEFLKLNKEMIIPVNRSTFQQPAQRPLITGFINDKAKRELNVIAKTLDEALGMMFS